MSTGAMTRAIPVANNRDAIVDAEDFDALITSKWHKSGSGYPTRHTFKEDGTPSGEGMHRAIMGLGFGDKRHVDHMNGDRFDNRRCNLRICEPVENWWNQKKRSDNTSGYKGVSWSKSSKRWTARIKRNGKRFNLGCFDSPTEAHAAYCVAAKRLHGDFANTGLHDSEVTANVE